MNRLKDPFTKIHFVGGSVWLKLMICYLKWPLVSRVLMAVYADILKHQFPVQSV